MGDISKIKNIQNDIVATKKQEENPLMDVSE
jgi:hypothetical protein